MNIRRLLVLAFALLLPLPIIARSQMMPRSVVPYVNAWTMTFHPDSGADQPGTLWEDRMDTVVWRGRSAMRRTQIEHLAAPAGATRQYVNIFDPRTLAPFMREERRGDGVFDRWQYDGIHVTHTQSIPGGPGTRRQPPGTVFDSVTTKYDVGSNFIDYFGGMYATVMALQPLRAGLDSSFKALLTPDTIVDVHFRVGEMETVRGVRGKPTRAYKVELGSDDAPGGAYTAWVTSSAPYVLRLTRRQSAPAGTWSWDEVE